MPTRSRTTTTTATAVEEPESEAAQEDVQQLKFNEPLSWRAGKPIPLGELLNRLETLSKELRDIDQEDGSREAVTKIAKDLVAPNLISHKDKGVKAWTACCLVDILRLCAPDAPYTERQLKDIFTLFITSILPTLSDPLNAYNNQHVYVLQSLAQVKSIVLLTDIPSSDQLTLHIFNSFFDMLSGLSKSPSTEQIGKHVEHHMTEILVILVDEATSLPSEVVDIIVAQFLRVDPRALTAGSKGKKNGVTTVDERQSTLLLNELPPAYNMAKTVCNMCPEKMSRYVSQYFNEVILESSASATVEGIGKSRRSTNDWEEEDGLGGPTEEDMKELHKAHRLLRELWRASPAVLQNVIPQLETELSQENVQLRLLATETLGDIVSGIGASGPPIPVPMDPSAYPPTTLAEFPNLVSSNTILTLPGSPQSFSQAHPSAYSGFLSRRIDRSSVIRSVWTTAIGRIIMTSAGGVGLGQDEEKKLVAYLAEKLVDSDERVRISAIKAVEGFGYRDVILKLDAAGNINSYGSVIANLADRVRDKKHGVRTEAMKTLARLWGVAAGDIADENELVKNTLGFIPTRIFDACYINELDVNLLVDEVLHESLIPTSYPPLKSKGSKGPANGSQKSKDNQTNGDTELSDADKIRTERILVLAKDLEPKAKIAFFAVLARQSTAAHAMTALIDSCEKYNGGVMDENEASIKAKLARTIEWLSKSLPDAPRASADLWKFAKMHDRRAYQLVRFCMSPDSDHRTIVKAIRELTKRIESAPGSPAGLVDSLTPLLYRCSLLIYNKSHVPPIVQYSNTDEKGLGGIAHEFLKEISNRNPEVFKAHVKELCRSLEDKAPSAKKANEPGTVDTLKACAAFAQKYPAEVPKERKFLQTLISFAQHGTPPSAAKHAVTILMRTAERKELHAKELLQRAIKDFKFGSTNFLTHLATISQLSLLGPKDVMEKDSDSIIEIAINQTLLKVRKSASAKDPEWVDEPNLDPEAKAKLLALHILVNRLRSTSDAEMGKEIAPPVIQLLTTLIINNGELSKKKDTPASHKSRLRLLAAQLFLKLCSIKHYDTLLTPKDFNQLAFVAQDHQEEVRNAFISKLKKYLGQNKLPLRFYTIPFLLAFEPSVPLRESTVTWIRSKRQVFASQKLTHLEALVPRFLSLLAHHPDFSSADDVIEFANYIIFYLNPVATEENLGLIYYYAQRVKQTRDALNPEASENLYILSDLFQAVVRRYEEAQGWSMQAWPVTMTEKLRLPGGLFGKLPSHAEAQKIAEKTYLPEGVEDKLEELVRTSVRKSKAKKRKSIGEVNVGAPAKKKARSSSTKTLPIRKPKGPRTPRAKKNRASEIPSSERRTSSRVTGKEITYAESGSEDEVEEVEEVEEGGEGEDDEESEDEKSTSPLPAPVVTASAKKVNGKGKTKQKPKSAAVVDSDDEMSPPPDEDN